MPTGLKRYQQAGDFHLLTFSCDQRRPYFKTPQMMRQFELSLEQTRIHYQLCIFAYVVMPEHVHLLVNEPGVKTLSSAVQALKQSVSRKAWKGKPSFWLTRYHDFNVQKDDKFYQKISYIHRNPVARGLVSEPADWEWSSCRHYRTGKHGIVEIESWWTQAERDGLVIPQAFLDEVRSAG